MSPPSSTMFLQVKQSLSCARGLEKQLLSCTYIICVINCCTERDYLVLGLVRYCHLLSYSPWMFSHLQYCHRYICHKLSPTQYSIAAIIQQEIKFSSKLVSILSTLDLPHYVSAVQSYTISQLCAVPGLDWMYIIPTPPTINFRVKFVHMYANMCIYG